MWHAWEKSEIYTKVWLEHLKETGHYQVLDVHKIILKEVLERTNSLLSFHTTRTA
jgi:hypothetical protein